MLHPDPLALPEGIDARKPLLHTGEEYDAAALLHQICPGKGQVFLPGLPEHGVHVGQDPVDAVGPAEVVGLRPEFRRRHAQRGDEGVVLHIGGAEGLIKVV